MRYRRVMLSIHHASQEASITLGSWPDWIAAIGTSLAFLIAAVGYFRSTNDAAKSQARLVYAEVLSQKRLDKGDEGPVIWGAATQAVGEGFEAAVPSGGRVFITREDHVAPVEDHPFPRSSASKPKRKVALSPLIRAKVRIHNGSDELIGSGKVQLFNERGGQAFDRVTAVLGHIAPHSDLVVDMSIVNDFHPGYTTVGAVVLFRDASDRWWQRKGSEPIKRVREPASLMDSPADVENRRAWAAYLGEEVENAKSESLRLRVVRGIRQILRRDKKD